MSQQHVLRLHAVSRVKNVRPLIKYLFMLPCFKTRHILTSYNKTQQPKNAKIVELLDFFVRIFFISIKLAETGALWAGYNKYEELLLCARGLISDRLRTDVFPVSASAI